MKFLRNLIALFAISTSMSYACTDFMFSTKDGAWINGRSMEFAYPTNGELVVHPQGESRKGLSPNGGDGLVWKNKYGYVAVASFGITSDGMNEKGLGFGALWMPDSVYQDVPKGEESKALALQFVGDWLMGNFETVAEVKEALKNVYIWGNKVELFKGVPVVHLSLHDAKGDSLVIEFIDGHVNVFDNTLQVLTNYPRFEWHKLNLNNYIALSAHNAKPINIDDTVLSIHGQGSGMLGIPGDWTPPSRFVRAYAFKNFAVERQTADEGVDLALHLLNTVDIPFGNIVENTSQGGSKENPLFDYTQWVVVKDLSNKKIYFRSYENLNVFKVDLTKIDFKKSENHQNLSLNQPRQYADLTDKLQ
jgi:choloylglycine hydrolase